MIIFVCDGYGFGRGRGVLTVNCMSKISFKAFCIEYYASHAGIARAEAYRRFDESGL